jgi:hypothetical protein
MERSFFDANYRTRLSWEMQDVIVQAKNMKHGLAQAFDYLFFALGSASHCVHQHGSLAVWHLAYKFY